MLQRLCTGTQALHNVAYFSDLNLQTMQQSLLLIYLLKLVIYRSCHHGIYAHFDKGGQKLTHLAPKTKLARKNSSNNERLQNSIKLTYN